ncbi:MAG: hypothetical protein HFE63_07965 [Clostridiales bacterium]|nr:hypothetical protein [Clostridiales bacterium]
MKRKIIRRTIIVVLITLLLALITYTVTLNMGVKINNFDDLLEEYKEYYIYKHRFHPHYTLFSLRLSPLSSYSRIWFLPFQKSKLLNKLKEDVSDILTDIVLSDETAIYDYSISDDFKEIIIYVDQDKYEQFDYEIFMNDEYSLDGIIYRVMLYNDLLHGYDSLYYGDIIKDSRHID